MEEDMVEEEEEWEVDVEEQEEEEVEEVVAMEEVRYYYNIFNTHILSFVNIY